MKDKKTTNKVFDIFLTMVVIFLTVGLVVLEVGAYSYDTNASEVATRAVDKSSNNTEKVVVQDKVEKKNDKVEKPVEVKKEEPVEAKKEEVVVNSNNTDVNNNSYNVSTTESQQPQQPQQQPAQQQPQPQQQAPVQEVPKEQVVQTPPPPAVTKVGRVNINGSVSVDRATYLNNAVNYIPSSVVNAFDQLGFKIEIGNYNGGWAGLFDSSKGYIYINNGTSMDLVYVLTHEFGHFVDLLKNLTSESTNFRNIYNEERHNLAPRYQGNYNYYVGNINEYFAECFSQYLLDSGKVSVNNPKSYTYVQNSVNSISQRDIDFIKRCLSFLR